MNKHAPLSMKRVRANTQPWLTEEIRTTMKERGYHHKKAQKSGSLNEWFAVYRVSKKKLMLFQIQISCKFHYGAFPWVCREQIVIEYTVRKPILTILARLKLCILTYTGN